ICTFMGVSREDFLNEMTHANKDIVESFETGKSWNSPKGSYFTSQPLGKQGVAFVYPGAFNSYPGMGRKIFDYFPQLNNLVKQIIKNVSYSLSENLLYPRYLHPDLKTKKLDLMQDLYNHPNELIESGISLSVLHTLILKNLFQITPKAAFGYSLGEISMLWANSIWQNAENSSEKWKTSSLFRSQLFGPMNAVREYWKDEILPQEFWASYILKSSVSEVEKALEGESQVFLTIINTPDEVVIAGKQDACQRVINNLTCHALPMPFNAAIHNPAMESAYPDFVDLYTLNSRISPEMNFYSAAEYEPLLLETESLSRAMAKMTCSPVNFPKLVDQVYQDGVRIFIEVGPQKTCSHWIEKILHSQPHAVVPVNKKHQPDYDGVLKVLSLLVSHQVPLDLNILYPDEPGISCEIFTANGKSRKNVDIGADKKIKISQPRLLKIPAESQLENGSIPETLQANYLENLTRLSADTAKSHQQFLDNQQVLTRNLARVVQLQTGQSSTAVIPNGGVDPLYTKNQIMSFTKGNHRDCFGDIFANFEDRRIPRLPNGDLRFIDRIMNIQGESENVQVGSSLVSEFDLPTQAWYLKPQDTTIPHVSLMELALQPCGFLSAYMGSIKNMSDLDLYFRNLDGEGILIEWPAVLGHTLTNRVELLSTSTLKNVVIQEYSFELSTRGSVFYQGKSSFGYFPLPMLLNQSGLDGNQRITPWMESNLEKGSWVKFSSPSISSQKPELPGMPEIKQSWVSPTGGNFQKGYIFTEQTVPSNSWFYDAHFYQDPVMPGSLGIETIAQAIIKSAPELRVPENTPWRIKPGTRTAWKYRGQITRETSGIKIDFHIKDIIPGDQGWKIIGDGNLWKEDIRIYQVTDLSLESY
ncbi:MAG: PfaB family protein, partial [Anaerolineales bacterium]|nr:PfaB family protein [Anaerolineales bacterium]